MCSLTELVCTAITTGGWMVPFGGNVLGVYRWEEVEEEVYVINPLLGVITSACGNLIRITHQRTPETHQTSRNPSGILIHRNVPPPPEKPALSCPPSLAAGCSALTSFFAPIPPNPV